MTYNVSMGTLNPTIPYHTAVLPIISPIVVLFEDKFANFNKFCNRYERTNYDLVSFLSVLAKRFLFLDDDEKQNKHLFL